MAAKLAIIAFVLFAAVFASLWALGKYGIPAYYEHKTEVVKEETDLEAAKAAHTEAMVSEAERDTRERRG